MNGRRSITLGVSMMEGGILMGSASSGSGGVLVKAISTWHENSSRTYRENISHPALCTSPIGEGRGRGWGMGIIHIVPLNYI